MYSRILVPLDGSTLAEGVLPYVKQMAASITVPVKLVQVLEPTFEQLRRRGGMKGLVPVSHQARAKAGENLEKVAEYLRGSAPEVTAAVLEGVAAAEIIGEAEKNPMTLVAMSTHGRTGIGRWVTGSVADKVLRYSSVPLLLVHPKPRSPIAPAPKLKTVVVPLDGSDVAEQAIPEAIEVVRGMDLSVILVRVTPTLGSYFTWYAGYETTPKVASTIEDLVREVNADAMQYLETKASGIQKQGIQRIESRVLQGDPAAVIIDLVSQIPDCFVAMTTKGRGGVARAVLGSVTDRIVRHGGDPVLVVRPT